MVMNLKEMLIIRKYTDLLDSISGQAVLPAGTTATLTFTPPAKYVWFPVWWSTGSQPFNVLTVDFKCDGTTVLDTLTSTQGLENLIPITVCNYAKREATVIIKNSDTQYHTIDAVFVGFLIREDMVDEFINEITGRKDTKLLEDIKSLLMKATIMK